MVPRNLDAEEYLEVLVYKVVEWLYQLISLLVLRRTCYVIAPTCSCTTGGHDEYFPSHGAFIWELDYWITFRSFCRSCGQAQRVVRSFSGISGALYRLPGYKQHDGQHIRILYLYAPPETQMAMRIESRRL